jgi:membrane fusion protein (multidrug efflux system)
MHCFQFGPMTFHPMSLSKALVLLVVVSLCFFSSSCSKQNTPVNAKRGDGAVPVDVQPVGVLELDRTLSIVGTLFAKDEATIGAEVEGRVEKTMVEFGDRVAAGQELASIDTASYEALARQASANVAKARATADNGEKELARMRKLGAIASPSDLDKALWTFDQANAEVKAVQATEAIAKLNLERSHVKAPFEAAIAERIASAGDFKKVGEPLFRVVNDGVLKYIVQAPERYAGQIQKGQSVTFTVDAYPGETFEGKVFLISPQVNTTTRAFAFGALVQNPDRRLRASTFARGEVVLQRNVASAVVPLDAVVSFVGINKIFVVENGVAKAREVVTGRVIQKQQEILSGVKVGESIVVSGQTKLFDGAKVRVKEPYAK